MGQGVSLGEASQEFLGHDFDFCSVRLCEVGACDRSVCLITLANAVRRYFLQKVKLGEGSFGTVWRAVDRQAHNGGTIGCAVQLRVLDTSLMAGKSRVLCVFSASVALS